MIACACFSDLLTSRCSHAWRFKTCMHACVLWRAQVLLMMWSDHFEWEQQDSFQFLELFSGAAHTSRAWSRPEYTCTRLCSCSWQSRWSRWGSAVASMLPPTTSWLVSRLVHQNAMTFSRQLDSCPMLSVMRNQQLHLHACIVALLLRVACYACLQLAPGCLGLVAPDCRSWGTPARGSSWRNALNVLGIGRQFVLDGNLMASRCLGTIADKSWMLHAFDIYSALLMHACMHAWLRQPRTVLCCLLILSQHAFFLVEQPRQSLLFGYYRWQWLQERISWASLTSRSMIACMHAWHSTLQFIDTLDPGLGIRGVVLAYEIWIRFSKAVAVEEQLALCGTTGLGQTSSFRAASEDHSEDS